MRSHFVFAVLLGAACASVSPRFEQDVATTFAQDDMRRLQTADVELYYPAAYAEQAKRIASRAAECVRELRALQKTQRPHERVLLFLTSSNYNNAYVAGQQGGEPLHSLNPLSVTEEIFHWYGLGGSDTGDIACHEMFHYVHFEQVENLWRIVNAVVGPVVPSQAFLERWFTEGVAQYYEGRIHRRVGRPHSPLYQGAFDSYVAQRHGELGGGDFSVAQRELAPFSGAYLTGLAFVQWLSDTYGEDKLWELMDVQGRSLFSPFGATLRFKRVYGLSAGALLDEWNKQLKTTLVERKRPDAQHVLVGDVGQIARLATHLASGRMAIVSSGVEQVATLRIVDARGTTLVERKLAQFLPGRSWILTSPIGMSGLSFTGDGAFLYLMNDDFIDRGDTRTQLWKIDASTGDVVKVWQDLGRAMGGSVSFDGTRYTSVVFDARGGSRLVERELETGAETTIYESPAELPLSAPAWSPDHSRLVVSVFDGSGWNLVLIDGTKASRVLTSDSHFNYAARWVDGSHVIFARSADKYLQAHRLDVDTGLIERLSDTPYGVIDPNPVPTGIALINREGSHWSLDVVEGGVVLETHLPAPPDTAPPQLTPRHEPEPLTVEEDGEYSSIDHLFVPQLRTPALLASLARDPTSGNTVFVTTLIASLSGKDRLGRHAWAINGSIDLPTLENSVSLAYRNLQLAPWAITVSGERDGFLDETYWTGAVTVGRTVFTTPVTIGFQGQIDQLVGGPTARYLGPAVSAAYSASESTAYGGLQRLFAISVDAAGYAKAVGSTSDLLDLRLSVAVAAPLPVSKRHSFVVSLTGRTLPGAPEGALRVGGVSSGTALYVSNDRLVPKGPGVFLPGTLVEANRGFDDYVIRATAAAMGMARYRYSFIIDRGFMSLLYLFPSVFFRQIDAEIFGSSAVTNNPSATWARAAGAAVIVRALFGGAVPVSLSYQFAWRFDFGLPPLHTVAFSFD